MPGFPQLIGGAVAGSLFAGALAVTSVVLSEPDRGPCNEPTVEMLAKTVAAAAEWMERSLQADGSYWYEYDRVADVFPDDYHDVRHGGVTMSLYQVAVEADGLAGVEKAAVLATGDRGRDYIYNTLTTVGDAAAFGDPAGSLHLGATALAVAGLVHRRIATGSTEDDELLRSFGEFMRLTLRDDGGMWFGARYRTTDGSRFEPTVGLTSTFYTGEAFWAFGLLHNQFPDDGWDDNARAVANYIATQRDTEEEIENPPLADQWSAYGFSEMRAWATLESAELDYVRSLIAAYNDRVSRETRREADRLGTGGDPDETVRQTRGAAFGTTVEALSALWRLSAVDPGLADLNPQARDDLVCSAAILAARQVSAERAAGWPSPEVVEGAWFVDDVTRMDDQQHAMSGVALAIDAIDAPGKTADLGWPGVGG